MDKEEALMDSDFGSISNGEFLTPLENGIHPTIEEDISETNLGETTEGFLRCWFPEEHNRGDQPIPSLGHFSVC